MKKILTVAAIAVLALTSCKKDRTCKCTYTPQSSTTNGVAATSLGSAWTTEDKITKTSKKSVDCNSGTETSTNSSTFGGTTYTTVDVTKVDCSLS